MISSTVCLELLLFFKNIYKAFLFFVLLGIQLVFSTMPAAFAELEIPPVYALLFYLSLFICGFMFLVSTYKVTPHQ